MRRLAAVLLLLAACGGGADPCHPEVAHDCWDVAPGVRSCSFRLVEVPAECAHR